MSSYIEAHSGGLEVSIEAGSVVTVVATRDMELDPIIRVEFGYARLDLDMSDATALLDALMGAVVK